MVAVGKRTRPSAGEQGGKTRSSGGFRSRGCRAARSERTRRPSDVSAVHDTVFCGWSATTGEDLGGKGPARRSGRGLLGGSHRKTSRNSRKQARRLRGVSRCRSGLQSPLPPPGETCGNVRGGCVGFSRCRRLVGGPYPTRRVVRFLEIRPEIRIQRAWGQGAGDSLSNDPTPVLHRISNYSHPSAAVTTVVRCGENRDDSPRPAPG